MEETLGISYLRGGGGGGDGGGSIIWHTGSCTS